MSLDVVPLSLAAALSWGAADFSGGLASRRSSPFTVVLWTEGSGLIVLLILAWLKGEAAPPLQHWWLPGLAGALGGLALVMFYYSLAGGQMSIAAPLSGVLAAAIPVVVTAFWLGLPGPLTLLGLALALAAIVLVSGGSSETSPSASKRVETSRPLSAVEALRLRLESVRAPLIAGVFFGLYFVLLHLGSPDSVLWPLIFARGASILLLAGFVRARRQPWLPTPADWGLVLLSGLLDTGANMLFILAGQLGRLDIAAVLSSLYPGATAALAWLLLKERISRSQLFGIAAALAAIVLITK